MPKRVEVGILTFREDELEAVLERFPKERITKGRRMYTISQVALEEGERYTVAVTRCAADPNNGDVTEAVYHLAQDMEPRLLLLVGIAAGFPSEEIALGDVVVATRIADATFLHRHGSEPLPTVPMHSEVLSWAANLAALLDPKWNDTSLTGCPPTRPLEVSADVSLQDAVLRSLKQSFDIKDKPVPGKSHHKLRAPRARTGLVAASDDALDDRDMYALAKFRETIRAIETRSVEVYHAALGFGLPVMSIRGIGEVVGLKRDPEWIRYACRLAASFALSFLKARPIAPHGPAGRGENTTESSTERRIELARPFRAKRLFLSSVRGFRELDLRLEAPTEHDKGQWTVLLGDNGIGKTTLLRALALALSPGDVVHAVLGRMGSISPTVQAGKPRALIRLDTHDEEPLTELTIEPSAGGEVLRKLSFPDAAMPFVVAYGSRRGSGLIDSGRSAEPSPLAAVETLFDEGASLMQPDSWLIRWQLAALQNGKRSRDARFFDALLATLCKLLPEVNAVHVSAKGVEVDGPSVGRVPLGALSDGYRTTMGWILDMVARWVEEARRRGIPVDNDFHKRMAGVAIVDEIDLHLHPRWQRDVISMVREHFRRMSFVVTTHNPLTLLGAQPGEIHVLRRNAEGEVEIVQRDLPKGTGAERILTGEWFGLPSTLDEDTLDKLAEHQRLIREEGLNAPKAAQLEAELRRRLGSFADTPVERLAHEAVAEHIEKDLRELSPEERRAARAKIAALLGEKPSPAKTKPRTTRAKRSAG